MIFKKINQNKQFFNHDDKIWNLSLGYIQNKEKLFGIYHFEQYMYTTQIETNCATWNIFDFNQCKWTEINIFPHTYCTNKAAFVSICKNNDFDNELIYVQTNNGHTQKYELNKDTWITLYKV